MTTTVEEEYGADTIVALEGLEAVYKRPAMYIGTTDKKGLHHLIWEVVDNSVDEAMGGHADRIEVTLNDDNSITVTDNGRGIPVAPQKQGTYKGMPTVEMVLTVLHAGGKFEGKAYQFSGGLHGVGISVVNALSEWTKVDVKRDGKKHHIEFGGIEKRVHGKNKFVPGATTLPLKSSGKIPLSETGTSVTFLPDLRVFSYSTWDFDMIATRLRQGAFLNPGLTFVLKDNRNPEAPHEVTYCYPNGLVDFMNEIGQDRLADSDHGGQNEMLMPLEPIRLGGKDDVIQGEWDMVLRWYPDTYYRYNAFANGINTPHGGTHVKGYEQVLTMLMNRYARQDHIALLGEKEPNLEAADVRSGLGVIISVKVKEPQFVGQTKEELSNDETRRMVREGFSTQFWNWMESHPVEAKVFIWKCIEEMRLRHKIASLAQAERNKAEKRGFAARSMPLPAKLSDCATRDRSEAELFITEGESAAAPTIKCRDPRFQAVLPIRGKGLNIEKALSMKDGAARIENNAEVQGLIATIGAGSEDLFDLSKMRYDKIILLTDADDDGRHIQLLLMTMFYRLMPELVRDGRLYLARPPLFSTATKNGKIYLQDEAEREAFLAANPRHPNDFLRFKGLGEMNFNQLGETAVNPKSRKLARVTIEDDSIVDAAVTSLMSGDSGPKWEVLKDITVDSTHS